MGRTNILNIVVLAAAMISCVACTGPSGPTAVTTVPVGVWGSDQMQLTVTDKVATVEFACSRGTLDAPIEVDASGHFDVAGTFVRGRGGPVVEDEKGEPATYAGTVKGNTMTLTVTSTAPVGTFTLVFGQPGRFVRCL